MTPRRLHARQRSFLLRALACAVVATIAATASVATIRPGIPPHVQPRALGIAVASTHVLIDLPTSVVRDRHQSSDAITALSMRATLLGGVMTSDPVRAQIAARAGVPAGELSALASHLDNVPATLNEPDSERRATAIRVSDAKYHIQVQPDDALPVLNVYAQAPTVAEAQRIADAAAPALGAYLDALAAAHHQPPGEHTTVTELGDAHAAVVNGSARPMTAGLTFLLTFGAFWALLATLTTLRARRAARRVRYIEPLADEPVLREEEPGEDADAEVQDEDDAGATVTWRTPGMPAMMIETVATEPEPAEPEPEPEDAPEDVAPPPPREARPTRNAGDWPRTTRVLPWSLAAFLVVIWLVPFNVTQLTVSTPIDLKFDRIVLAPIMALWLAAICAGGPGAPRWRITWIHRAIMVFVGFVCLSLVLNAHGLNHTLELDQSVKKLVLLGSYLVFFAIAASTVRRTEIHAFLTYTLWLAVLCAIGTIVEYRFHYNVFYAMTRQILPGGVFSVGSAESSAVDDIGRRIIRGPGEVPLEAVTMMSMALPLALTGILRSEKGGRRLLYSLAACLLLAAIVSTYRKSAFLAPISVVLTLAYFRRRELMRLAPLGVVLLAVIHVLSPGAFGAIAGQLHSNRLDAVATVSDRKSDYDAIRPDVWSHLLFGRGFGSYDHNTYRILDNELLGRLIEIGVLGLISYLVMIVTIVVVALPAIRARGEDAHMALSVAAAAICFLVVSVLFDVMSFPHCPYILLWMAALLAASRARDHSPGTEPAPALADAVPPEPQALEPEDAEPEPPREVILVTEQDDDREPAWNS